MARRKTSSFNLSFIDIISCGLGAVVLLLILIKDAPFFIEQELNESEIEVEDNSELQRTVNDLGDENDDLSKLIINKKNELSDLDNQISDLLKNKTEIQKEVYELIVSDDLEENKNFLSSCKLDRDKTLVLLDSSSSMLAYNFIDVLKAKSSSDQIKRQSEKFNTAKRILQWLLEQADDEVRIDVGTFSKKATFLSDNLKTKNDILNDKNYLQNVDDIIPNGETNFYEAISTLNLEKYKSIFFITDGLPTSDNSNALSLNLRGCNSGSLITSDCRERYFKNAMDYLTKINSGIQINTILLYLEGDPRASIKFSIESWRSRGCFITIPQKWP